MSDKESDLIHELVAKLFGIKSVGQSIFITTPFLYPSGDCVVVQIERDGDLVTELGSGYDEAKAQSLHHLYRAIARKLAEGTGVTFDRNRFFVKNVHTERLAPVISAICNLSVRAVTETMSAISEDRSQRSEEFISK